MTLKYHCRHCGSFIGQINESNVSEYRLGFHFLTPEERKDIISYNHEGDVAVKVVCDYCKQAFDMNPELSLIGSPLQ